MDASTGDGGRTDVPAGWHPDPTGRFTHRYFDGQWTNRVANADGVQLTDALGGAKSEKPSFGPAAARTPREQRRKTVESLAAVDKYRKPLREGTLPTVNFFGGSWNEFAEVALTGLLLETMLDVDERLEQLTEVLERIEKKL